MRELSWRRLGELLTRKFPGLRSFQFALPERFASAYDAPRWEGLFDEYLPELRGIASVTVKTYQREDWRYVLCIHWRRDHADEHPVLRRFDSAERLCWAEDPQSEADSQEGNSDAHEDGKSGMGGHPDTDEHSSRRGSLQCSIYLDAVNSGQERESYLLRSQCLRYVHRLRSSAAFDTSCPQQYLPVRNLCPQSRSASTLICTPAVIGRLHRSVPEVGDRTQL